MIDCDQRIEGLSRRQAMSLIYYTHHFIGIDSFGLHVRAASGNKSDIFFVLEDMVKRIGYSDMNNFTPIKEVTELIEKSSDYQSNILGLSIENIGENCPILPGFSWFGF
jgi:prophage antirepressor-like protein